MKTPTKHHTYENRSAILTGGTNYCVTQKSALMRGYTIIYFKVERRIRNIGALFFF